MTVFWRIGQVTLAPMIRLAWRIKVSGREHIPKEGPAVLASNHLSFLDHFVLPQCTWRQIFFISKAEHFENPVQRWAFKQWGVIPLRRGAGDQEAFDRSLEVLQDGALFGIYPEGTRSRDGKLHKGRTGVARLAILGEAPIVPCAMIGTFEAMPKGVKRPRFNKLEARIGPPIDTRPWWGKENDRAALRELTDLVMQEIAAVSGQQYVDEYQQNPAYQARQDRAKEGKDAQASDAEPAQDPPEASR